MGSHGHVRLGEEFPRCDFYQVVIFLIFLVVWGLDSFMYRWTVFDGFIPEYVKTVVGLFLVLIGGYLLKEGHRLVLGPEEPVFVDWGVYGFCRHPMYLGGILIYFGFVLCTFSGIGFLMWIMICLIYNLFAAHEEKTLEKELGITYLEYKKKVRRWFVF